MKILYSAIVMLANCRACLPSLKPMSKASCIASKLWRPSIGSVATCLIASGFLAATSSISMPPSAEASTMMRLVPRSRITET